jgi:hypothetical protein
LVFGALAAASGVSLIAVRGRGLPAPVTASNRSGIWQMAIMTVGSALAGLAMLLWGLGVFGTEDPLHVFGFVCAACGGWLTWRGVLNIRRMIEESSARRP